MNDLSAISPSTSYSLEQKQSLKILTTEFDGRKRASQDLLTFASTIEIPGAPLRPDDEACDEFRPVEAAFGKHQLLWLDCLQRVQDGEIQRLLGLMPPGSAKSTYTSIVFPVHTMARFPKTQIIVANYGSDLPRRWGRKARSIVRQDIFRRIFGTQLSSESAAADEWALQNGSEYLGAGLLTGITGNRADGVIWDDLIKGREQADSALIRQKTWDAYFDDLLTRKKPRAFEIGITTRWHEDDVAGRILPGELWRRERLHRLPRRQPLVCRVHSGRSRARRRRSWARQRRAHLAGMVRRAALCAVQAQCAHLGGAVSAATGAGGGRLLQGATG